MYRQRDGAILNGQYEYVWHSANREFSLYTIDCSTAGVLLVVTEARGPMLSFTGHDGGSDWRAGLERTVVRNPIGRFRDAQPPACCIPGQPMNSR